MNCLSCRKKNVVLHVNWILNEDLSLSHPRLIIFLVNCKDEEPDPCTGYFYDKPLENVKHCLLGKWQIHSASGGFFFERIRITDRFLTITNADSVIYQEGQKVVRDKIKWSPIVDIGGHNTYMLEFDYFGDEIYRYQRRSWEYLMAIAWCFLKMAPMPMATE